MVTVSEVTNKDIKKIVELHEKTFKDFFLTSLGSEFLELYYTSYLDRCDVICLCAKIDNEICGFTFGTIKPKDFHIKLLKDNFKEYLYVLIKIALLKPKSILRLIKNQSKNKKIEDQEEFAELMSIGVDPKQKKQGIGALLINNFEVVTKRLGLQIVKLTTDGKNNEAVVNFYKKNGYEIEYKFIAYPNREMIKFKKNI